MTGAPLRQRVQRHQDKRCYSETTIIPLQPREPLLLWENCQSQLLREKETAAVNTWCFSIVCQELAAKILLEIARMFLRWGWVLFLPRAHELPTRLDCLLKSNGISQCHENIVIPTHSHSHSVYQSRQTVRV